MNTLTPDQIPTSCEVAGIHMPIGIPWVCGRSPTTHTLEGRIYHCEDGDLVPIRLYICDLCVRRYTTDKKIRKYIDIQPLTTYEFV